MLCFSGCGIYSFVGIAIHPDAETIHIGYFKNNAPMVNPRLSQLFTDALKDRFSAQTKLDLINKQGDLNIEGSIIGYSTQPVAIQDNETAALTRLTITIKVKYTNLLEESKDFETTFSRYEDYSSSQNLSSVEDDLIEKINEYLVDDVFNKSVVNW